MKIRLIYTLIYFYIVCSLQPAFAQVKKASPATDFAKSYSVLWKEVEHLEEQSLPQSALIKVEVIYQKALMEKNSPDLLKSLIYRFKNRLATDNDQFPVLINEIEQYTASTTDEIEKSMLYSMLANLYWQYYQSNSYQIRQRTALSDYVPKDIREWTGNIFCEKIKENIDLSIQHKNELQVIDALEYAAILNSGESSRKLRSTLYDFLVYQGIELFKQVKMHHTISSFFKQSTVSTKDYFVLASDFVQVPIQAEAHDFTLQILKLYQALTAFRMEKNNLQALLFIDLERLNFVYQQAQYPDKEVHYLDALTLLEKQYINQEECVEILVDRAEYYIQKSYDRPIITPGKQSDRVQASPEKLKKTYEICQQGIERYPKYERIGLLKNLLQNLTNSTATVISPKTMYPGDSLKLQLNFRNIRSLTVEVYKIDVPTSLYGIAWDQPSFYKTKGKLIDKKIFQLHCPAPYIQSDTVLPIPVKDLGCYEYVLYSDNESVKKINKQFSVSSLASVSRSYDGIREFLVTDRMTGQAVEGAKINLYTDKKDKQTFVSSVVTDKNGLAISKVDDNTQFYHVTYLNDSALTLSSMPWNSYYQASGETSPSLHLMTDRGIYRPGQIVFFKGIIARINTESQSVLADMTGSIVLRDANFKEISKQSYKTNEFGSFSGEFLLPQNGLNGEFTLGTEIGSTSFRVEEYKRPTFNARFLPIEKTYLFGDMVSIKGEAKTFSGINLQHSTIKYRIIQRQHWFCYWIFRPENQVAEGSVQSDEHGQFQITFPVNKRFEDKEITNVYYTYEIQATLTNSNGESQELSSFISVGDKSMILQVIGLDEKISKEGLPQPEVNAFNLNDTKIQCRGQFEVYSLQIETLSNKIIAPEELGKDQLITSGNFTSGEKLNLKFLEKIRSGRYRMYFKTNDDQGREINSEVNFILYSEQDKIPPIATYEWVLQPKTSYQVGDIAEIIYGSSAQNVSVLYEIFKENKKLSVSRFELNNSCKKLEIPFLESYGKGVSVNLIFIKNGQVFARQIEIVRQFPNKKLDISLDIFRDKLLPGQKEEWKISIKDADKKPVIAELLSSMYDASLDQIVHNRWNFEPLVYPSFWNSDFIQGMEFQLINDYLYYPHTPSDVPVFSFDSFNWFGLNFYTHSNHLRGGGIFKTYGRNQDVASSVQAEAMLEDEAPQANAVADMSMRKVASTGSVAPGSKEGGQAIQIRQNFAETAFFFPQLKTNEAGESLVSFTVPESNTTWKFMALAHTKDLKYGQIIKEAISQKQLMVAPNMPRFVRQGDMTSIATNISNLSDQTIKGNVSIEFFDPVTEKIQFSIQNNHQQFSVEQGKTIPISWTFEVPSGIELTACRIVAKSANFSDGEQHLLPVLSNRMLVTESIPLYINGIQTRQFKLGKLVNNPSKSLENYRLTLEFAGNPTWYAVQSLPTLLTPINDNVVEWFGSYYSNALATHIANNTPRLRQVIDTWTKQGGSKETLLSNLEKNQELKTVLIEETPWVLEAESESRQKQQLSLLFDLNRSENHASTAIQKLKELQTPEGAWVWFKGFNASPSLTEWILYCFSNLKEMKVLQSNEEVKDMQAQAIKYIDNQFQQHFEQMKKYQKDWTKLALISTHELEYLFVRSLYINEFPLNKTKESYSFFLNIAEKYWTKNTSLYDRSINAIVLNRNNKQVTAQAILRSLKEYAQNSEELGTYWANNSSSAFQFQSATVVHTFIMRAFKEVGAANNEMDEMKRWLLKQKQTQQWENVPATVNSIAALLQTGSNWLESKGDVSIQLGKETIRTADNKEAGTAYFKKAYSALEISPEMGEMTVTKRDEGPAWGSVYWQYFEELNKITQSKIGLNVEKKLFIEKTTASGKILEAVTPSNLLKIGDKMIVRLTIRSDRDMEYVLLKDMRAACFEPVEQVSGTKWKEGAAYYQTTKDASTSFFFESLRKGTYVFEYPVFVNRSGEYSNGITTIQCMYAPEFVSYTAGEKVNVK